jgi:hypothetical protein
VLCLRQGGGVQRICFACQAQAGCAARPAGITPIMLPHTNASAFLEGR